VSGVADFITVFSGFAALGGAFINFIMFRMAGSQEAKIDNLIESLNRLPTALDGLTRAYEGRMNTISGRLNAISGEIRGSIDSLTSAFLRGRD
jgi:hypothetical protein